MTEEKYRKAREAFDKYTQKKKEIIESNLKIKNLNVRKYIRPLLRGALRLQRTINKFDVEFINFDKIKENRPIIFAVSHIGKWDFEIVNEFLKQSFVILASDFINMYGNIGGLFMNLNGVIFVDIDSKEDRKNSEIMMKRILNQGHNIMIFPEGTWNLTKNKIILYPHLGAVSAAMETKAIIIPISIEQYNNRFVINKGEIFDPYKDYALNTNYNDLDDSDRYEYEQKKKIKIIASNDLRDRLATLKYEIWLNEGIQKRDNIPYNYWQNFIEERKKEWPGYSMDEQIRNGAFPKEILEYNAMVEDLCKMKINKNNEFLFTKKKVKKK